jgi:hypothetical protein
MTHLPRSRKILIHFKLQRSWEGPLLFKDTVLDVVILAGMLRDVAGWCLLEGQTQQLGDTELAANSRN